MIAVFAFALRSLRRATIAWSVGLAALVAATVAFWPAFKGASGITDAINSLPPAVIDAFGLQNFGSPAGFLRGNLYELFVPLLFGIAVVAMVNGQTAADEAGGRLELFLAEPIPRWHLFLARAAACLVALAAIVVATIVVQVVMDEAIDLVIDPGLVAATAVLCGLLAALFGSIAYLVACLRPKPSLALACGAGLLIAGYVIAALFPISKVLEPWKVISPWNWALGGDPLVQGAEPWRYGVLVAATLVLIAVGTLAVRRRDVAAA